MHGAFWTLYSAGKLLTEAQAERAAESGWSFLRAYQEASGRAFLRNQALYKLRPKFHYFGHALLGIVQTRENPRRFDLFQAECLMGKIKRIGRMCHWRTLSRRVIERYILFLSHRWHTRRRSLRCSKRVVLILSYCT